MAKTAVAASAAPPKPKRRPRRKKATPGSRGLNPTEVGAEKPADGVELAERIREDGGAPLAIYREPLGGHTVVLAGLPIDKVEPTPYQRDLSKPHVQRLATAMERVDRYLDPMIAVRHDGKYWTPNGNHRLGAARLLGTKAVVALVLPEENVAYQILALNTEKAHNLKERSLEVIRMVRGLLEVKSGTELDYAPLFEEPSFITLGIAYEQRPRFSGGAYHPILKRTEQFLDLGLQEALRLKEQRGAKLLELDDAVTEVVNRLKANGLTSPYLKYFVVARINFLRFKPSGTAEFAPTVAKMLKMAQKFDVGNVRREDLARMGGAPMEPEADE